MRYPWYKVREGNLLRQRKELRALAPQGDHAPVAVAADDVRQAFRWEGLFLFYETECYADYGNTIKCVEIKLAGRREAGLLVN